MILEKVRGWDIERLLAHIGVKMVVCGDPGVKKVPDGDRKEFGFYSKSDGKPWLAFSRWQDLLCPLKAHSG